MCYMWDRRLKRSPCVTHGKFCCFKYLFPVNSQRANPIEVSVTVERVLIAMELDTGAAVSVISEHTYHSTWPHDRPALQPSLIKLRTYSGEELEEIGIISVQVCYEDQQEELPLLVV